MDQAENKLPADFVEYVSATDIVVVRRQRLAADDRGIKGAELLFPRRCLLAITEIESHGPP
jgi:hypothetical protein